MRCSKITRSWPPRSPRDLLINVLASDDPGYIADYIAQNIAMRSADKQKILEELHPVRRLEKLYKLLQREVDILSLDAEIQSRPGSRWPSSSGTISCGSR